MTPPIVGRSVQIEGNGTILEAVMSVATQISRPNPIPGSKPWPKGVSGNPGGRPRLARAPSVALAELNDATGANVEEAVENYKTARKAAGGITMADHKAIALTRAAADVEHRAQVAAFEASTDRLEGKVPQAMNVKSEATLTIQIVPLYAMMDGKRAPELLEAEVVEEGEK
jgi:hypothetical protein